MEKEKLSQFFSVPFEKLLDDLGKSMPEIIEAIIILLLGFVIALILRWLSYRLIASLQRALQKRAKESIALPENQRNTAARITSRIIFWGILLFFLAASLHALNRPVISQWIHTLAGYFPNLLAAFLIIFLGYLGGNLLSAAVQKLLASSKLGHGELFGKIAKYAVLLTAGLVAVEQIGININLLIIMAAILTGMFAGGMALAFALGSKTTVKNILANYYLSKYYQVGQRIQIGDIQGKITRIENTHLCLETSQGVMTIPAAWFLEKPVQALHHEAP